MHFYVIPCIRPRFPYQPEVTRTDVGYAMKNIISIRKFFICFHSISHIYCDVSFWVVIRNVRYGFCGVWCGHYENMPLQINWKFYHQKTENFQIKNSDILPISAQNIDCGYSLEPPRRGDLTSIHNLYFRAKIRKIIYIPLNPGFTIQKWGLRGSKLYRRVFVLNIHDGITRLCLGLHVTNMEVTLVPYIQKRSTVEPQLLEHLSDRGNLF